MTTDELVDEIFGRCRERIERGERVDVDDVLRAHPDLAGALRARFAAARLVERSCELQRTHRDEPAAAARVGAALGPYRIEAVLGTGGMGTVYLARVEDAAAAAPRDARVALKVLHPHLVEQERFAARFLREAELGRRVEHANVVRTLAAEESTEAGRPTRFLVMEHVEGRTLRTLLAESGRLPEELCRHIGREVAKGLAAIHAAGAVHRDLKPENVIVTGGHAVKVMDLGVARIGDAATLSESGAFVGSLRYGAPEQFGLGGDVDHRVDLHALGLLLYELATGVQAFAGGEFREVVRQVLDLRPRRCGELVPQLSPFFEELVAQLLEKDRARRPESAAAVAAVLAEGEASAWWTARTTAIRRETRRPLRRIRIPRETALHGRAAEIARLRELFDLAKSGDGQVVLVEGEAGIGKSRLVDEFATALWAQGEDFDCLAGSYPPGGAATASGAFTTAYREHLGDDEATLRAALPETPLLVPAFAALLRGDAPPEGAEKLTKDSVQTLFVHATRSLAARRTTVVLIDDLHFAPEDGRALFTSLALAAPGHRILLLGGARRSLDEKWSAGLARLPAVTRLRLERLGAKDLVDLLHEALRSRHLAEELSGRIAAKSDGNPYFVFEILRGLREGRFLTRTPDGSWITTRSIRDIDVPPSVVDVIQARVADLDADDRNVLEAAACIGFEFDAAILGAALRVEPIPLLQRLGGIEKRHRLVRSVGHLFAFDHHQAQEVLYAGLSAPLREAYHASIAEAIETRSGAASRDPKELDGGLCAALAEHFLAGARGERALRYLDAALTHLESQFLNDAAVRLCDLALGAPGLLAGAARWDVLMRKSLRLTKLGAPDAFRATTEEMVAVAEQVGDLRLRAKSMRLLGWAFENVSRQQEAHRAFSQALTLFRDSGDVKGEILATANLGSACAPMGRNDEARGHLEHALALACELGDAESEALVRGSLGVLHLAVGRYEEAREHLERGLALHRAHGDKTSEAWATSCLGYVLFCLCRRSDTLPMFEHALAFARASGDRRAESQARGNLAMDLWWRGRIEESVAHQERRLALTREIGNRLFEAITLDALAWARSFSGRYAEAIALHERELVLSREVGHRSQEANARVGLAILLKVLGRLEEARDHLRTAISIAREIRAPVDEAYALLHLAYLDDVADEAAAAERGFTEALSLYSEMGSRENEGEIRSGRGRLFARLGRIDQAREDLEAALAISRELSAPWIEVLATARLTRLPGGDAGPAVAALDAHQDRVAVWVRMEARHLLWLATRDRAHLAEAKRLLDLMVESSPPECRETMLTNYRDHREVVSACRAEFGGAAGGA